MINRINPEFNPDLAFQYHLSILLRQDGFSFIVSHSASCKILLMQDNAVNVKEESNTEVLWRSDLTMYFDALQSIELLNLPYATITIAVCSERYMLVPEKYAEVEGLGNLLSVMHTVQAKDKILSDSIIEEGPVCSALIPTALYDFCRTKWRKALIKCATSVTVKGIMRSYSQLLKRQIFLQLWGGYIEIFIIQGTRLLYANSFKCKSVDDVLYYLVFVLEQLGFSHSDEELMILGGVNENSDVVKQMQIYFANVAFARDIDQKLNEEVQLSGALMHEHFTLLNIPLCV